jgi:tyrosyl-DNA phosphodiesterase 1
MKLQSVTQQKQLQYMHPYLCQWAGDRENSTTRAAGCPDSSNIEELHTRPKKEAGRRRAAPHIKTYIRLSDGKTMDCIDWAMITSANLSTQAWGAAPNSAGEVRICSWEIGVIVWPELIAGEVPEKGVSRPATMVPCFKRDLPDSTHDWDNSSVVGFRMPYDLPLTTYSDQDVPWCATINHAEPDWLGQTWET